MGQMSANENLCKVLRSLACRTWRDLQVARLVGSAGNEEGITNRNLRELKFQRIDGLVVREFSRQEEFKEGADWEWWFRGVKGKWVGMRLQAKVIDFTTNEFKHLHYKAKNSASHQSDVLISSCAAHSHEPTPVYVLYCEWPVPSGMRLPDRCDLHPPLPNFGCSIVKAEVVSRLRSSRNRSKALDSLVPYMRPWHVLGCECGVTSRDIAEEAQQALMQMPRFSPEALPPNHVPRLHDSAPIYVEALMKGDQDRLSDLNLSRVMIFDQMETE